jgi:hypothetical protein
MRFFTLLLLFGAGHLGLSYLIITTTAFIDVLASSTLTILATTSTAPETPSTASALAATTSSFYSTGAITNVTLPPLPLNGASLSALDSLMNLILTIPDNILQEGDQDVVAFYSNVSYCLTNVTSALENAVSSLIPEAKSIGQEIASVVISEGSKATSFLASLTSDIPGAVSTVKSIAASVESDAASIFHDVTAAGKSIEPKITSAAPALVTEAGSIITHATSEAESIGKGIVSALHLPFKPRGGSVKREDVKARHELSSDINPHSEAKIRTSLNTFSHLQARNLSSTIAQISALSSCLSSGLDSNPLFEIGNCALHIADLISPAAKILKIRDLIGGAGGAVKIVQTLGNAKDATSVVKIGGKGVLDAFKELSGVGDVISDCKFLVQ